MSAEGSQETCSACGAPVRREKITYTQIIGDKFYIVKDVPAEVCARCGEEYLSPDTVDAIQETIENARPSQTVQVPVYHLAAGR